MFFEFISSFGWQQVIVMSAIVGVGLLIVLSPLKTWIDGPKAVPAPRSPDWTEWKKNHDLLLKEYPKDRLRP